jgi:hypothetical protein
MVVSDVSGEMDAGNELEDPDLRGASENNG